ncbi:NOP protein chaperone 1 [Amia ocellicauda]|uniref:NOP protein chaperone 1 n=1 Tax=Amia ocellicauda TaxID=2972642 RepID=UPI0034642866
MQDCHIMEEDKRTERKQEKVISKELLSFGKGRGLNDKLLLNSKDTKNGSSLQTVKVPRSNVLDRLQCFLPQIAQANEKLKQDMESCPAGQFEIENIEGLEKIIEMDVAVVELSDSEGDSLQESESESEEEEDEEVEDDENNSEITEGKLKLPGKQRKRKANIEVLDSGKA